MPSEYMGKTGAAFDWTLYEENIEPQKKIVNAFVKRFAEFEQSGRGLYIYSKCKGSGDYGKTPVLDEVHHTAGSDRAGEE